MTQSNASSDPTGDDDSCTENSTRPPIDEGPGWMPAIMAATVLMGIFGFIFCAFSTYVLFGKRTELALRTVRESFLPQVEQSYLAPQTKSEVVEQISQLSNDLEGGRYEGWQAAGVLQRLQRLPILQWGELQAVEAALRKYVDANPADSARVENGIRQITRLQYAVAEGGATSFDFHDALQPIYVADPNASTGHRLDLPLTPEAIDAVIDRARLIADREKVPDQVLDPVRLAPLIEEAIRDGAAKGTL